MIDFEDGSFIFQSANCDFLILLLSINFYIHLSGGVNPGVTPSGMF